MGDADKGKVAEGSSSPPAPAAEKVGDWCDSRAAGDPCAWPLTQNFKNAVRCGPMPAPVVAECLQGPAIIPSSPVFVDWPQEPAPPTPDKPCGPNPYSQIPDSTVRTVVEMVRESKGDMIKRTINHPLCPDAQLTLTIDPPQKKEIEIRVPECVCPVRAPGRQWIQCVESQLINDRVRRPLARCCHKRELPPIVIPCHELERLKLKMTEKEREREEREERIQDRECERLKSNYRHSLWNYTVDSVIDRKRKMAKDKIQKEIDDNKQLVADIHAEKTRTSKEELARANQQMLYRKGLIRDFHAALANSKMIKDIEDEKERMTKGREGNTDACTKKMMWINNRPEYPVACTRRVRPINRRRLELLRKDEARVKERKAEMHKEQCEAKELRVTCPDPLPESYKKYIAEPKCDPNDKRERQQNMRNEIFAEIHDKLATDAFIEAHENEIDRQACEFTNYKRTVQRIQKEKEEQLIAEKVAYNQRKQAQASAILVKIQAKKQARSLDYDRLKDQWETAWEEKMGEKGKLRGKYMNIVYKDFWERRSKELCRQQLLDPSRQYARERLVAIENYEQECDRKSDRRRAAEELALYHQAQVQDRLNREMMERRNDAVFGCKAKKEYEDEMCEMKTYANECIQDWALKGRPTRPMVHAMKKWDYDAGMSPRLFRAPLCVGDVCDEKKEKDVAKCEKKEDSVAKCAKKKNRPDYQTTSKRLGFACGGGT